MFAANPPPPNPSSHSLTNRKIEAPHINIADAPPPKVHLQFQPALHDIVDLDGLGRDVPQSLNPADQSSLSSQLKRKGWCIVRLPEQLSGSNMDSIANIASETTKQSPQESSGAKTHKTSYQYRSSEKKPSPFAGLESLTQTCQRIADALGTYLSTDIFGATSAQDLASKMDVPVPPYVYLLDFVKYLNARTGFNPPPMGKSVEDVNVVPHVDPGFFSISFFSSAEGLQLLDPETNQWHAAPLVSDKLNGRNLGVLWLGTAAETASNGTFKAGFHRVIYPKSGTERLAAWFEVCTRAQLNPPVQILPPGTYQLPHIQGPENSISITEPSSREEVVKRGEKVWGLPMSKAPAYFVRGERLDLIDNQKNRIPPPQKLQGDSK